MTATQKYTPLLLPIIFSGTGNYQSCCKRFGYSQKASAEVVLCLKGCSGLTWFLQRVTRVAAAVAAAVVSLFFVSEWATTISFLSLWQRIANFIHCFFLCRGKNVVGITISNRFGNSYCCSSPTFFSCKNESYSAWMFVGNSFFLFLESGTEKIVIVCCSILLVDHCWEPKILSVS